MAESLPARGGGSAVAPGTDHWLSFGERIGAAIVGAGALAVLMLASTLTPSASGLGTHQQLGLPACTWTFAFGLPCPSCGMTTAFAHAARGDLLSSFVAQPAGALLAVVTAMVAVMGLYAAITGSRVLALFSACARPRFVAIGVAVLLIAWGYKIAQFRGWFGGDFGAS